MRKRATERACHIPENMKFASFYTTLVAVATAVSTTSALPLGLARDTMNANDLTLRPTASDIATRDVSHDLSARSSLSKRNTVSPLAFARELQQIHDQYNLEDEAAKTELTRMLTTKEPYALNSDFLPETGLTPGEAIVTWPESLYKLIINTVKQQDFVDAWMVENQSVPDKPKPEAPAKPEETKIPDDVLMDLANEVKSKEAASSASSVSAASASAQAQASAQFVAAGAVLAGVAQGAATTAAVDCPACSAMAETYTGPYTSTPA